MEEYEIAQSPEWTPESEELPSCQILKECFLLMDLYEFRFNLLKFRRVIGVEVEDLPKDVTIKMLLDFIDVFEPEPKKVVLNGKKYELDPAALKSWNR